jgi:glutamyl/glutaminyl-tRNA synthetase
MDKKGGKLSKRQGDVAVEDYLAKGYLPETLINFCVLLGWSPYSAKAADPDDKHPKNIEILNLDEIIKIFDYKNISVSPAVFDIEKLDYLNGYYIRKKSLDELTELCLPFLIKADFIEEAQNSKLKTQSHNLKLKNKLNNRIIDFDFIKKVMALEQERLKKLSEIGELTEFFFIDKLDYPAELLVWKKMEKTDVKNNLEKIYELLEKIPEENWANGSIEENLKSHIEAKKEKTGEFLWPMRVALTGREASPSPFDVAEVLGKEECLKRINNAIKKI